MKYKPDDYIDIELYSDTEGEVENYKKKVVKCRKPHKCANCQKEINSRDHALLETGFMDGKPVSCYTCLPCIDVWLDESGQVEREGEQ